MQRMMLGAYWPARQDTLDECVDSAEQFFAALVRIDPALSHWYERGRSRKDALSEIDVLDRTKLRDLLVKGQNRKDVGGAVIEDLGFRIGLWNGASREDHEASLSVQCGSYNERINNSVVIDLPIEAEGIINSDNASALVALVAKAWRPSWAGIMSKRAMRERDFNARNPFVDWLVYVPRALPESPSPSVVEPIDAFGSIVMVQPSPPTGNGEDELRHIRQVEKMLAA